jgi:hypothetical protein
MRRFAFLVGSFGLAMLAIGTGCAAEAPKEPGSVEFNWSPAMMTGPGASSASVQRFLVREPASHTQASAGVYDPIVFVGIEPGRVHAFEIEGYVGDGAAGQAVTERLCWVGRCEVVSDANGGVVPSCEGSLRNVCAPATPEGP